MVYQNKLVACVKVAGRVLREVDDSVTLPFGSEYSILIKNLNTVRALVKISIDGQDVSGSGLIVQPNSSVDIERFIKNGNLKSGNRFKFIERTKDIEDHRGVGVEDGLIRIEYSWEKQKPIVVDKIVVKHHYDYWDWPYTYYPYPLPHYPTSPIWSTFFGGCSDGITYSCTAATQNQNAGVTNTQNVMRCASLKQERNDSGITVPGSQSNQEFTVGDWFPTYDQSEVLVIKLRGAVGNKKVKKPVTTKSTSTCPTCGKSSKSGTEFCSKCGTALTII